MSDDDKLIVVGQIAGAFGVKGEVRVRSFTDDPEAIFDYGPLLDAAGKVVLTPMRHRSLNDLFSVTAKEALQREAWEAMRGTLLHTSRAALPETDEGEVYVADLIGARVVHVDGRELGVIKTVQNFGAGELLEIKPATGQTYLLPFTEENFPEIHVAGRVLTAAPDEALLPEPSKPDDASRADPSRTDPNPG
ncbi:MAG: ribosome maturation factor RimM [Hyphomonadaceae bacterium]